MAMILYVNMVAFLFTSSVTDDPLVDVVARTQASAYSHKQKHLIMPNPPIQRASKIEELETYYSQFNPAYVSNRRIGEELNVGGTRIWSTTIDTGSGGYILRGYLYLYTGSEWRLGYVQQPTYDNVGWRFTPRGTSKIDISRSVWSGGAKPGMQAYLVKTIDIETLRRNIARKRILK